MGAWIEIQAYEYCVKNVRVAPYMGAWIEIWISLLNSLVFIVAPYMGAWIEIFTVKLLFVNISSHPTWVRGLK